MPCLDKHHGLGFQDSQKEKFELKPYTQIYQNKDLLFLKFSKQVRLNVVSELNGQAMFHSVIYTLKAES